MRAWAHGEEPPRVGLLNPAFVYVPAANTNIRLLFERVRQQMAQRSQS